MNPSLSAPLEIPPVVFLVFNRPVCTAKSLALIREARPARLYVVADGPRRERPGEGDLCAEVRTIIAQGVDWPCDVIRDYAPANLGLARRVSSGLDAVFAKETAAIILEDDCLPDPTFFRFCAELLERYRDEPRVGQIAGCTFQDRSDAIPASYYFSRYPHCWGWATWRRAWSQYDHTMAAWKKADAGDWLAGHVPEPAERRYWAHSFDATAGGKMDSWAYRWTLALWRQNCVSVTPYRNLVANIGFDASATHTQEANALAARPTFPMSFPLVHPTAMAADREADERTSRFIYRRPSLVARILRRLRRSFAAMGGGA